MMQKVVGRVVGVVLACSFVAVVACDKKAADAPANGASESGPLVNVTYTKKLPSKGSKIATQHATRGGTGDTRPSMNSAKTSEAATDRQARKQSTVDKVDCANLPDNTAECDGDKFYFCDDKALWYVDCNAEAKFGGVAGGSCFEGDRFIDCLGCDAADDGTTVCCDFNMTVCCDKDGACYSPKG